MGKLRGLEGTRRIGFSAGLARARILFLGERQDLFVFLPNHDLIPRNHSSPAGSEARRPCPIFGPVAAACARAQSYARSWLAPYPCYPTAVPEPSSSIMPWLLSRTLVSWHEVSIGTLDGPLCFPHSARESHHGNRLLHRSVHSPRRTDLRDAELALPGPSPGPDDGSACPRPVRA